MGSSSAELLEPGPDISSWCKNSSEPVHSSKFHMIPLSISEWGVQLFLVSTFSTAGLKSPVDQFDQILEEVGRDFQSSPGGIEQIAMLSMHLPCHSFRWCQLLPQSLFPGRLKVKKFIQAQQRRRTSRRTFFLGWFCLWFLGFNWRQTFC